MDRTSIINMLIIAIVCIALIFVVRLLSSDEGKAGGKNAKKARTDDGVAKTVNALRRYASAHDFGFLAPAPIKSGERCAQLDAVIVTFNQVIGVRCDGRNGEVFANPGDKQWLWVSGEQRTAFDSPADLAAADMRILRDVLSTGGQRTVKVECHPVFTSGAVSLAVPKSITIWRDSRSFLSSLNSEKYMEDKGLDKDAVLQLLTQAAQ